MCYALSSLAKCRTGRCLILSELDSDSEIWRVAWKDMQGERKMLGRESRVDKNHCKNKPWKKEL